MKKLFKRLISTVLAVALVTTLIPMSNVKAASNGESTTTEFYSQDTDGEYLIKMQVSADKMSYQIDKTKTETNETTTYVYDNGILKTYNVVNSTDNASSISQELISEVDFSDNIKLAQSNTNTRAYRPVTKCIVPTLGGNNLWYQVGSSGADVGYMLMGCDWTYRIKANADSCETFRSKVNESNDKFLACGVSEVVAIAAAIAIIVAGPVGAVAAAAAFGVAGTSATLLISACFAEEAAHDAYDVAKVNGIRQ